MTPDQDTTGFASSSHHRLAAGPANHPLAQASMRLADVREGRLPLKARDLVGLLLCHGARAWRASQPVTFTRVGVRAPCGTLAVRMRQR